MKKKIYILSFVVASFAVLFAGCDNAEYEVKDNSVYLSDAAGATKSTTLTMDDGVDITVNVRLAKKIDKDVEVEIKLNPSLLDSYNEANNSEYYPLTDLQLPAGAKVTIPAGEIGAVYTIHVDDFDTGGKQYALGVELGNVVAGGIEKSASQSRFIYLLAKPLNVSVPILNGRSGAVKAAPETNWGITTAQWSLECWARMSAYSINNQAIFYTGSDDHEIYIRFGDANSPYNYLQIKTLGGQIQTPSDLEANKWYHWAFVYDGTTLTIYQDGEERMKFDPPAPAGGSVRFDYLQMISSGSYFRDQCAMSQVRLWKTAISQTQIKNNMYYSVNPANPDLISYWPMDEGDGNSFADITGNGHDATADTGVVKGWEHGIRFDQQ
ncbi:hypothetical protein M2451_001348 [Dysgonomonas sp. PFB1-18]|uniref:DUF1735 and LamG domain-containing protein n=1 Tax=unclassified Dysgonomonas TaxID=2630389 RepID=UPI0024731DBE|nr:MULTISPECIES: DUF1735 and LamG domain-containing protein [unclassified Dysgonomonas]MDH6308782.1 hypothetical protein [Dysgonomonas sp. PF1-14]MDH6338521.1 hypothetical protein [Dysgonomonas sp. PF1-16]MDH6380031.1 hypothetical protein [Dysgonomonas sp. PFB1-18]MDH6397349.1 hypothetical protein [Dysgonomonas sp. PF1-23]